MKMRGDCLEERMAKKARKAKARKVKRSVKRAKPARRSKTRTKRKGAKSASSWLGETAALRRRLAGRETFED